MRSSGISGRYLLHQEELPRHPTHGQDLPELTERHVIRVICTGTNKGVSHMSPGAQNVILFGLQVSHLRSGCTLEVAGTTIHSPVIAPTEVMSIERTMPSIDLLSLIHI